MKKQRDYFSIVCSIIAGIISILALSFTYFDSKDKKTNTDLYLKISEYKSIVDYQNRIDTVFRINSENILKLFEREKGVDYIIQHKEAIKSIYLSKITYDLVNDSYKDFFSHHGLIDLYNSVGNSINIGEVVLYSHIFWNSSNYNDLTSYDIDQMMKQESFIIDDTHKLNAINELLESIKKEQTIKYNEIEKTYSNVLHNRNLDKDLIDNFYKLNTIYVGSTLSQVKWFEQQSEKKQRLVDSYIESYFYTKLIPYMVESIAKK